MNTTTSTLPLENSAAAAASSHRIQMLGKQEGNSVAKAAAADVAASRAGKRNQEEEV